MKYGKFHTKMVLELQLKQSVYRYSAELYEDILRMSKGDYFVCIFTDETRSPRLFLLLPIGGNFT